MPITDDLRLITDRTLRELDAAHDYVVHSRSVWVSFEVAVRAGYTLESGNPETGTKVDQAGLVALADTYQRNYLLPFTLRQFVSEFESFFFAFLARLVRHNPWQLKRCRWTSRRCCGRRTETA